jgi:hypothetical protein
MILEIVLAKLVVELLHYFTGLALGVLALL